MAFDTLAIHGEDSDVHEGNDSGYTDEQHTRQNMWRSATSVNR